VCSLTRLDRFTALNGAPFWQGPCDLVHAVTYHRLLAPYLAYLVAALRLAKRIPTTIHVKIGCCKLGLWGDGDLGDLVPKDLEYRARC
jgi:hypothetical protein